MRNLFRIAFSVFFSVILLSAVSVNALADSGLSGSCSDYDWTLKDGVLNIKCKDYRIDLKYAIEEVENAEIDSVILDFSDYEIDSDNSSLIVDGYECGVVSLTVKDLADGVFDYIRLWDMPELKGENVSFPKGLNFEEFSLDNVGITSLGFLDNLYFKSLTIENCPKLEIFRCLRHSRSSFGMIVRSSRSLYLTSLISPPGAMP